ncbi:hypothetical protein ACFLRW_05410 [Acidobacteriota bacterium]
MISVKCPRLTFCLDTFPVSCSTFFNENTNVIPFGEEEAEDSFESEPIGGITHIDPANNLTYIDIEIVPATGNGGPGGKKK